MNVILLEKVKNLGDLGDQVRVRPGFGRNYLLPQKKAVPATAENIKYFEERRAELERAAAEALAAAQGRAEKIAEIGSVNIVRNAGEEGKLYGSVGPADIAEALEGAGVDVAKSEVLMPDGPIHTVGEYELEIQLHSDVLQSIKVNVEAA